MSRDLGGWMDRGLQGSVLFMAMGMKSWETASSCFSGAGLARWMRRDSATVRKSFRGFCEDARSTVARPGSRGLTGDDLDRGRACETTGGVLATSFDSFAEISRAVVVSCVPVLTTSSFLAGLSAISVKNAFGETGE